MIEAGKCFCYHCGNVFTQAYYKNPERAVGVLLKRPRGSRDPRRFSVEPYSPSGAEITDEDQVTFESAAKANDGLPNSITVRTKKGALVEMFRSCPMCVNTTTTMYPTAGKYRTFVIGMVGDRAVGKSTWLQAIATAENYVRVNNQPYVHKLVFTECQDTLGVPSATSRDGEGNSNVLLVVDKKTGKTIANVVLVDAAGEHFRTMDTPGNRMHRILLSHGEYPGADACLFFESAESRVQEIESVEELERRSQAFRIFNKLSPLIPDMPIAYVCTHTDKLVVKKKLIPRVDDNAGREMVPLFTSGTFSDATSYDPKVLLPRFVQEDLIARTPMPAVLGAASRKKRRGFMVQSCANAKDKAGKPYDDFRKNFNVMDPLLWVLDKLELFPLVSK